MTYEEFEEKYMAIIDEYVSLEDVPSSPENAKLMKDIQDRQNELELKYPEYCDQWFADLAVESLLEDF